MVYAGKNKVHCITWVMTYHTSIHKINSILSFTSPRGIIGALCHPHTSSPLIEVTTEVWWECIFVVAHPMLSSSPPMSKAPSSAASHPSMAHAALCESERAHCVYGFSLSFYEPLCPSVGGQRSCFWSTVKNNKSLHLYIVCFSPRHITW